mgnify:CR=1 FL=1
MSVSDFIAAVGPYIAPTIVAAGGIAALHYRFRGEREKATEDARRSARETFEDLFREERQKRDDERQRHIDELARLHAEHEANVAEIERQSREECEAQLTKREERIRAEHASALERWKSEMAAIVREVARLVGQLDPYRTPTPLELERLRTALARGGVSPSDINGLIAARGVAQ